MRLACGHLSRAVLAFLVLASLKGIASPPAAGAPVASAAHSANQREKLLPLFVGTFKVVGCRPDTGEPYVGSVVVDREGLELAVQERIDGRMRTGTGAIQFEPETPTLEVDFGKSGVLAGYELGATRGTRQPRASGWVDPVGNNRENRKRLGMEVWYNQQPAPDPTLEQANLAALKPTPASGLGLYEGDYRIIGADTASGRLYTGKIRASQDGEQLKIEGWIDGQRARGECVSARRFTKERVLLVRCQVGHQSLVSIANVQTVGDNYPRICGYFYQLSDSGSIVSTVQPRLETWFFDWR
jgi:hypothetical protein